MFVQFFSRLNIYIYIYIKETWPWNSLLLLRVIIARQILHEINIISADWKLSASNVLNTMILSSAQHISYFISPSTYSFFIAELRPYLFLLRKHEKKWRNAHTCYLILKLSCPLLNNSTACTFIYEFQVMGRSLKYS